MQTELISKITNEKKDQALKVDGFVIRMMVKRSAIEIVFKSRGPFSIYQLICTANPAQCGRGFMVVKKLVGQSQIDLKKDSNSVLILKRQTHRVQIQVIEPPATRFFMHNSLTITGVLRHNFSRLQRAHYTTETGQTSDVSPQSLTISGQIDRYFVSPANFGVIGE